MGMLGDSILRLAARPIIREMNARRLQMMVYRNWRCAFQRARMSSANSNRRFLTSRERLPKQPTVTHGPWRAIESADKLEFPWG